MQLLLHLRIVVVPVNHTHPVQRTALRIGRPPSGPILGRQVALQDVLIIINVPLVHDAQTRSGRKFRPIHSLGHPVQILAQEYLFKKIKNHNSPLKCHF